MYVVRVNLAGVPSSRVSVKWVCGLVGIDSPAPLRIPYSTLWYFIRMPGMVRSPGIVRTVDMT